MDDDQQAVSEKGEEKMTEDFMESKFVQIMFYGLLCMCFLCGLAVSILVWRSVFNGC
jgi:ABC-type Mn2+/Zn2+ transport system permease subunit